MRLGRMPLPDVFQLVPSYDFSDSSDTPLPIGDLPSCPTRGSFSKNLSQLETPVALAVQVAKAGQGMVVVGCGII